MKKLSSILSFSKRFVNLRTATLIALCPLIAVTTSVIDGASLSIIAAFLFTLSALLFTLLERFIPTSVRKLFIFILCSLLFSVAEILLAAFIPSLSESLGVYLPLLIIPSVLIILSDDFSAIPELKSRCRFSFSCGLGFVLLSLATSFIRELFGGGTLFGLRIIPEEYAVLVLSKPAGGFMLLGLLIAATRAFSAKASMKEVEK